MCAAHPQVLTLAHIFLSNTGMGLSFTPRLSVARNASTGGKVYAFAVDCRRRPLRRYEKHLERVAETDGITVRAAD